MEINNSSQPYLYDNKVLYCQADHSIDLYFGSNFSIRPWKIRQLDLDSGEDIEVPTKRYDNELGRVILEANPSVIRHNGLYKLYWTAGFSNGKNSPILYYFCSMDFNSSINDLTNFQLIEKTYCGAVVLDKLIFKREDDSPNEPIMIRSLGDDKNAELVIDDLNLSVVNKITPIFNSDSFIVGGINLQNINVSLIVDKDNKVSQQIKNQHDYDVNKCSVYNNKLAYSISIQDTKKIVIENMA